MDPGGVPREGALVAVRWPQRGVQLGELCALRTSRGENREVTEWTLRRDGPGGSYSFLDPLGGEIVGRVGSVVAPEDG